jgi:hypothetical protein
MANVTYYDNIKPLFSQYDRVMMIGRFDLFNYQDVKQWANKLYLSLQPSGEPGGWSKLEGTHVMPKIPGPWPQEWVDIFKQWIDGGCLEGTPPFTVPAPPDANTLKLFISLSEVLTGFSDLGATPDQQELAGIYYNRLLTESDSGNTMPQMLNAWSTISTQANPEAEIATQIIGTFALSKDLIILWYNTTTNKKPATRPGVTPLDYSYYGTPDFNQFQEGLVWKATGSHPTAYAPENSPFYWRLQPEEDGKYSGQWIFTR